MSLSGKLIRRRKLIVVIWIIALVAAFPAIMGYSHYISYSTSGSSGNTSESSMANSLIQEAFPQNESLTVVVYENPYNNLTLVSQVLSLQSAISGANLTNVTGSASPFSAYESYINAILNGSVQNIRGVYSSMTNATALVFQFPHSFLLNWSNYGYNVSDTYKAAVDAGYNYSSYESVFLQSVNSSSSSGNYSSPVDIVQAAVNQSSYVTYGEAAFAYTVSTELTISNYTTGVPGLVSGFLFGITVYRTPDNYVVSAVNSDNPGNYYITHFALEGVPDFISSQYISNDNSTFLISVNFNTPSGYVGSNGNTPSQAVAPKIQSLVSNHLGSSASLTGQGAIAYQTQQITSKSGIAFAFIFVILAIAVFLTLVSYKASIITLLLVSIATALGYVAIYITGLIFHSVDYVVNYTLTAVILGVATDYIVFVLSRFRQEVRLGRSTEDAVETAVSKAGKAVFISGVTVAASLGMFSLVPGFRTWGSVLFIAIMLTVVMEVTLLPAIMKFLGPKIFMNRGIKPLGVDHQKSSFFYRAAKFSTRRKAVVLGVIFILAAPAVYMFFTLPTTYNFNTGLPKDLSSVQALTSIEQKFGANVPYPVYVIVPLGGGLGNGSLTAADITTLQNVSGFLNSTYGLSKVVGPYQNNETTTSLVSGYLFDGGNYSYYVAYTPYNPYSSQAESVVHHLRGNDSILVGGVTSSVMDQKTQNQKTYTELAAFIVGAIAVILFISFGSAKYPVISLSGVFISIVWTTAILFLVTTYILHETLIYLIPIILFVILMSLGNDYTVFVISRIKEEEGNSSVDEGIAKGMAGSGKVVTSLGLILAASLGSLAFIPVGFLQQLGIAFIISLILDTFIIRTLYFPAMISLFAVRRKKPAA